MAGIIDYIWQSTFCLFFLYGIYWCFLQNEKVFTFTRIFILIAPILALLFPLIEIPVDFNKPSISLENTNFYQVLSVQEAPEEIVGEFGLPAVTVSSTRLPLLWEFRDYFILSYFLIVTLLAVRILWQLFQLQMLTRKGWYQTVFNLKGNYFLVPTFGLAPIFSFFDKLFWDDTEQLEKEEKNQIIQHEIEHIKQGHTYDVMYYQILSVLFWFNPAIHLMRTALVDTHEYLADEKVLSLTTDKENYKKLVIRIAFKGLDLPIGNYFIRSTTLKRILMMKKSPKINWPKLLMVIPLMAMLMALVSMKSKQPILFKDNITIATASLQEQLEQVRDSLEVGIKVRKISNPLHYEYISPLQEGRLKAQLGELEYEISNITTDEEYIKVMGLLTSLRLNSTITKDYEGIYKLYEVDQKPKVEGGNAAWHQFLFNQAPMPEKERQLGLSNRMEVEFVVEKDGSITSPVIRRSFGGGLDEKFLAAIKSDDAPKWSPAIVDGSPVAVLVKTDLMYASGAVGSEAHRFFPKSLPAPSRAELEPRRGSTTFQGEPVFDVVSDSPIPQDGFEGWNKYLSRNLKYPLIARENQVEGIVYVVFTVTDKGEVVKPDILRGVGFGLDEEALRILENAPNWTPGKIKGEPVHVRMRLPIRFRIADSGRAQEAIVGENAENTLPAVTVTAYGAQKQRSDEKIKGTNFEDKFREIKLQIDSRNKIKFDGSTYTIEELSIFMATFNKSQKMIDQLVVNISAAPNLDMGTLQEVLSILRENNLSKVKYSKSNQVTSIGALTKEDQKEPMIIINNKPVSYQDFKNMNPNHIASMKVIKNNESKMKYGILAENGAVVVQLK